MYPLPEQLNYASYRMAKANYIRVLIDRAIHRELDYLVPETLAERVGVGSRIRVPFRDKSALATVVAVLEHSEAQGLRPIEAVVGDAPALSEQLLELARWISVYYCCPIEAGARGRPPAPDISREPNLARASQTRFGGDARRSGRPRSACRRAVHRNIKPCSECGAAPRAEGNYAGTRLARKRPPDFAAWSHWQRQDGNLLASDSGSTSARTQRDCPRP